MYKRTGMLAVAALCVLTSPASPARQVGEVDFQPCTITALGDAWVKAAQCASVEVAEDHDHPDGRRITLALALIPARRPVAIADPVVFLAGGPGQSAIESYYTIAQALERLRNDRDILLIDQRGTGGSNALHCEMPDAAGLAEPSDAQLRAIAEDCLAALGERADVRHYTTVDAVRDLETVRQRLGAPAFNLIGTSYGTRVALDYLRRYPAAVRTLVLDGVVPPQLALGQEHARNLETALARIFAACTESDACRQRFGDPAATLATLRARLAEAPMPVTLPNPRTHAREEASLTAATLAGVVRFYAYLPEFATTLPLLLDHAVAGDPRPLIAQGEMLFADLQRGIAWGMQLSVTCSEDADLLQPVAADADTLMGNSLQELAASQCAVWPHKPRPADFHEPVRADKPVLLLSGEWDPVTPARYGDTVAQDLPNARHLVVKGAGHITLAQGCVPKLLERFIDTADAVSLDTDCLAPLETPPFFLSFQGPAP